MLMNWLGYSGFSPYETKYPSSTAESSDLSSVPLDPIDQATVGRFRTKASPFDAEFFARALRIINSLESFTTEVLPPPKLFNFGASTDTKWLAHIETLLESRLLAEVGRAEVKAVARYFAVAKADMARSIYNGNAFSSRCLAPPPTNLPDMQVLLRELATFIQRHGGKVGWIDSDFRHYFHQIPLLPGISLYFCIRLGNRFFRWCTLPMGFSWSPFVAQALTMGILLRVIAQVFPMEDLTLYTKSAIPPAFIICQDVFAAAWYDNILIVVRQDKVLDVKKALAKVLCQYDVETKNLHMHGPKGLSQNSREYPTFLNLEFVFADYQLQWRFTDKKVRKWRLEYATFIQQHMTRRQVAQAIGLILWAAHISFVALCHRSDVITLLREQVAMRSADASRWDDQISVSGRDQAMLREYLDAVLVNPWLRAVSRDTAGAHEITLATDSSDGRYAYMLWNEDRQLLWVKSFVWQESTTSSENAHGVRYASIFLKELLAATLAIERATVNFPGHLITLVIDNTAALHVCRRRASSTVAGMHLAVRIDNALTEADCQLSAIYITSSQNPADPPSRNRAIRPRRIAEMWKVVEAHRVGAKVVDPHVKRCPPKKRVRHEESDLREDPDSDSECDPSDESHEFIPEFL
jgi:hypothetical protein